MAETSSPSDVAIREFSKHRSQLLYAQRKQLDAGRWEPAADRLLRRARVHDVWAAILALVLLVVVLFGGQGGRAPPPSES
jgi:hypothetical protein